MPAENIRSKKMITVANIDKTSRRLPYSTKMKAKIDTPEGKKIYSDRMRIIEPVLVKRMEAQMSRTGTMPS